MDRECTLCKGDEEMPPEWLRIDKDGNMTCRACGRVLRRG